MICCALSVALGEGVGPMSPRISLAKARRATFRVASLLAVVTVAAGVGLTANENSSSVWPDFAVPRASAQSSSLSCGTLGQVLPGLLGSEAASRNVSSLFTTPREAGIVWLWREGGWLHYALDRLARVIPGSREFLVRTADWICTSLNDSSPLAFSEDVRLGWTWKIGEAITPVTLPPAEGGSGEYTYTVKYERYGLQRSGEAVPGVAFESNTRTLSGTPTPTEPDGTGQYTVFYKATDRDRPRESIEVEFVVTLEPVIETATQKKQFLAVALLKRSLSELNWAYNDFGCDRSRSASEGWSLNGPADYTCIFSTTESDGYEGGHSGWDVQTKSVAGDDDDATDEVPFYSLTNGTVVNINPDVRGSRWGTCEEPPNEGWICPHIGAPWGTIAVYDEATGLTTVYLHARRIAVRRGQVVQVGDRLGIQGNIGLSTDKSVDEHVHVEVRIGNRCGGGAGADWPHDHTSRVSRFSVNPLDYLAESAKGGRRTVERTEEACR